MTQKPTLNLVLRDFWKTKSRVKVVYGGRASGKTWDSCGIAIYLAQTYKMKFLCCRQFQNRITESVYTTIKSQIDRFGLQDKFTITNNRILCNHTGSEFIFLGLWRSIEEVKSLEGVDVCYIEEAHALTKEQWDILEPTIRKEGSEFWIVFNPRLRTDFVYKNFIINTPRNCLIKKINYDENPFLSETMKTLILEKKEDNEEDYRHIYLGEPKSDLFNSLFNYKDLESAMSRNGDPSGAITLGVDVARFGDDSSVVVVRSGQQVISIEKRQGLSTTEVATWVANKSTKLKADGIIIDTIGVGAGVYDQLTNQGYYCVEGNFGFTADDNNTYANKRAESYFKLAQAVKQGLAIPQDDELVEELVNVTYIYTETGKVRITPKDKIKEELGRSPDKADALALTYFTNIHKDTIELDYDDYYSPPNLY